MTDPQTGSDRAPGSAARFGIVVVSNDAVPESEFWAMAPAGVSVHAARFEVPRARGRDYQGDAASAFASSPDLARGVQFLGRMRLDAICICFTTASILAGGDFDDRLIASLSESTGTIPATTTTRAFAEAMRVLGVRKPMVVVPAWFSDPLCAATQTYFAATTSAVAGFCRVDLGDAWHDIAPHEIYDRGGQWECRGEHVYDAVKKAATGSADSVVVVGNGCHAIDAIAPLEEDLGMPVLTANQVGFWHCLQLAGIHPEVQGFGRLFQMAT